jgi:hypothetical protein
MKHGHENILVFKLQIIQRRNGKILAWLWVVVVHLFKQKLFAVKANKPADFGHWASF